MTCRNVPIEPTVAKFDIYKVPDVLKISAYRTSRRRQTMNNNVVRTLVLDIELWVSNGVKYITF